MAAISVIVPIYNTERYLYRCIDSILSQTFNDFELVLVDDGSPDNCGVICDEYAAMDSRVKVIHQSNQGQAAARNHAVAVANGDWICFVDSDDLIHPQMLEHLYYATVKCNADISMCSVLESDRTLTDFFRSQEISPTLIVVDETELVRLYEHGKHRAWIACGKLIKKTIVQKNPFTEGRIYEDNAVVCRWLVAAGRLADVDAQMYFYRINPKGTTKSDFQVKHLDYFWALEEMIGFFRRIGYRTVCRQHIRNYMCLVMDKIQTFSSNTSVESRKMLRVVTKKRRKNFLRYAMWLDPSDDTDGWVLTKAFPKTMWMYWHLRALLKKLKRTI